MIAASAAIILGTSCSSDQEEATPANVEIKLRADVDNMALTRAATDIQGAQFAYAENSPELINVEIVDAKITNSGEAATKPAGTPARASYIFKTTDTGGGLAAYATQPYFPNTGNKVNIYAYYPSTVGTVGSGLTTQLPGNFSVATDQSDAAGYKASDLMYGEPYLLEDEAVVISNPVARTSTTIPLKFEHMLSKVVVKIQAAADAGITTVDLAGATVSMKAMITAPVTIAGAAESQTWTTTGEAVATAVSMGGVHQIGETAVYETAAIVVPQTIEANAANVLTVTLADGGVYNYSPSAALSLVAGKVHVFTLTLGLHGISVSATINPWGDGTGDTQEIVM